jgi:manganese/zinc/iron transport system permease protein
VERLSVFGLPYTDSVVVAGALVLGLTSGVLGAFAVLRGRSLVGDAVAHSTLPGVCVAFLVAGVKDVPGLLVGAALAGLVAALLMVGIERAGRIRRTPRSAWCCRASSPRRRAAHPHRQQRRRRSGRAGDYLFGQAAGSWRATSPRWPRSAGRACWWWPCCGARLTTTLFDPATRARSGCPCGRWRC